MSTHYKIHQWLMWSKSFQSHSLFLWCICSILIIHIESHQRDFGDLTTARGVFYTVGLKVNHSNQSRPHSSSDRPPSSNRHSVNQLKNQIKYVLNLHTANDTIDKYIIDSFNVRNPDPMYVFVLPDASNKTLVFRRSNFSDISFPNTTKLQNVQNFLKSSKFAHLFSNHDERMSKQLALDQRFFTKYKQFMSSENDLHEAESLRVIEENVRTEKNFFKFMNKLNDGIDIDQEGSSIDESDEHNRPESVEQQPTDYPALIRHIHARKNIGNYALAKDNIHGPIVPWPTTQKSIVSWDDFGLHGWFGKIHEYNDNPDENGNQMRIESPDIALREENLFPNKFLPILANYDPLALLTTSTTTSKPYLPPKSSKWPHQSIHQFSFVNHHNSPSRPRPPPIILSSMHQPTSAGIATTMTTQHPINWFTPVTNFHSVTSTSAIKQHSPSYSNSHRKPFKLDNSEIGWDVKFNVPDELRELLRLEKIKLENISQTIGSNAKLIVTSSRSKHRDADVFVARANNPFGHSTKWKLSAGSPNDVSMDDSDVDGRQKRDVIDLYSMVKCATGCDPLIFKGYGCYCGFLGSGKSVDGIDRCCKMHDYCYHASDCPKFLEYFVPYLWKCYHGRPLCAISNGEWGGPGSCSVQLCECDRALSNCLRRFYCPRKRAVCSSSPLRLLQNILMDI